MEAKIDPQLIRQGARLLFADHATMHTHQTREQSEKHKKRLQVGRGPIGGCRLELDN